jgi:erythronate-4-phosphate dehydrogenase
LKIAIDDKIPFIRGVLEPYASVEYINGATASSLDVQDADALVVRTRTACNAELLQNSNVRYIATATIGYDHIDAEYCALHNIAWSNAAGCNSGAVEQYVAAALLRIATKNDVALAGKKLGIVGAGNVGRRVERFARALGMQVLRCDPPRARAEGAAGFLSLFDLALQSDVISMHVPLSLQGENKTLHLANAAFFAHVKRNAIFINTSRGEVVDERALSAAIKSDKLQCVALDVWEHEPSLNERLLALVDIATPHVAGYSAEGKAMATQISVRNIAQFFKLPLQNWQHEILPAEPAVTIDCTGLNVQEAVAAAVACTYNIEADDKALRAAPHGGELLRGGYTYRREFSAHTLKLKNASDESMSVLRNMSFSIV